MGLFRFVWGCAHILGDSWGAYKVSSSSLAWVQLLVSWWKSRKKVECPVGGPPPVNGPTGLGCPWFLYSSKSNVVQKTNRILKLKKSLNTPWSKFDLSRNVNGGEGVRCTKIYSILVSWQISDFQDDGTFATGKKWRERERLMAANSIQTLWGSDSEGTFLNTASILLLIHMKSF